MWKRKQQTIASVSEFLSVIGLCAEDWRTWKLEIPHHYRRVLIPKRRSGHRELLVPDQVLMGAQRRLLGSFYETFKVPKHLTGGIPAGSIRKHAQPHVGKNWVATFDIRDFFGHVKPGNLAPLFTELGVPDTVVQAILTLCFVGGVLPQGAPTSPFLANLALDAVDQRILRLTRKRGLSYTRYLDDLAISGDQDFRELRGPIANHCLSAGFTLHPEKEAFMKQGTQQVVTGLVVNRRLRPTAEFYRRLKEDLRTLDVIRSLSHRRSTEGRIAHLAQFDPAMAEELRLNIRSMN
ncbi:MAG: RNA-directed DNA polymerase [Planctomycetota bacterium]|jgi:RNA-directed DNA polymerase